MADSNRETIVQAVLTLLGTITTVNGYEINTGNTVKRGIDAPLEKDDIPGVVLNEEEEESDATISMGYDHHFLPLSFSFRTTYTANENWYKVSNKMLADFRKALLNDTTIIGPLAIDIIEGKSKTGAVDGEHLTAGLDIEITIHYRTQHLNPYA